LGPIHTAKELVADLRRLGVKPGQTLMVHSSLKSLGWIPGGPVALIEALLTAVGPPERSSCRPNQATTVIRAMDRASGA
jgi:aminoglycoside N3'-acetyltransferase